MRPNFLKSLFDYVTQLVQQLVKLPFKHVIRAAVEESRLKGILPVEHTLPKTESEKPGQQTDQNPVATATAESEKRRWEAYRDKGGEWDYETWGNVYDNNIKRALQTNISVNQYHHEIGRGPREVVIDINGKEERLPVADSDALRGIEIRAAKYCTRSKAVMRKVAKHQSLVKKGWDITWKIEGTASLPLLKELKKAGININY